MQIKERKHILIAVILFLFMTSSGLAQISYDFHKGGWLMRHYYVEANVGANLFNGDISNYSGDPFNKLIKEASFGYSLTAGKWATPWLGGQFTFTGGQLRGADDGCDCEFKNNYTQYTGQAIFNLTQLFYPLDRQSDFYFLARLGYGLINFNSVLTNSSTKDTIHIIGKHSSRGETITEWVIPIGLSGVFNFDEHYSLSIDFMYNYTNTDKLDTRVYEGESGSKLDSYVFLGIGVKYTFNLKKQKGYNSGSTSRGVRWVR